MPGLVGAVVGRTRMTEQSLAERVPASAPVPGSGSATETTSGTGTGTGTPRLRGLLHAAAFPPALIAGILLVALAPTERGRLSIAVFTVTAGLLFGVSALYHRGRWPPRTRALLRRFDHSNIFLLIAGTYTPLAVTLLDRRAASTLLTLVWTGAVLGVAFRVAWIGAPRWLYVPVYLALGCAALFWIPAFHRTGGTAVVVLIAAGGLCYVVGALVYGFRRPDPSPRWFGFHEIFHTATVLGFTAHVVAVGLAARAVTA